MNYRGRVFKLTRRSEGPSGGSHGLILYMLKLHYAFVRAVKGTLPDGTKKYNAFFLGYATFNTTERVVVIDLFRISHALTSC